MNRRSIVVGVTTIFFLVLALATMVMAADPFVGTWKLNLAKSKVSDPSMMPKSEILKNVAQGDSIKTTVDGVDAKGKTYHQEYSGKWDGKDYAVAGDPAADMLAVKMVDENTIVGLAKKAGKEVENWQCTISKDEKTMNLVGKGKDEKGQKYSFTSVYDKQ